ncbi:unnamed protein product [Effrenium voratum]|uniref:Uncharacterized protein n=1 Tax=Effrenium voratum TaxID=2562239 RepID=A0AA36JLG7_9DINO|nr:unnamed protein product [Effrenium voratum]
MARACTACMEFNTTEGSLHASKELNREFDAWDLALVGAMGTHQKHVSFQEDVIEESGFLTSSTRNDAPSREASFAEKQGMFKESKQDARIQEQHKRRQRASVMLLKFLESNGFKDHVNCKKSWCLGFKYTYPLHEAAKQNDKAVVAWLLRFGADSGKRNAKGRTALDLIKDLESHCAVRHILERPQISWQLRGFGHFFSEVQRVDPLAHG